MTRAAPLDLDIVHQRDSAKVDRAKDKLAVGELIAILEERRRET